MAQPTAKQVRDLTQAWCLLMLEQELADLRDSKGEPLSVFHAYARRFIDGEPWEGDVPAGLVAYITDKLREQAGDAAISKLILPARMN